MTIVARPPLPGICHECIKVVLERLQIELFKFLRIVELFSHRVAQGRMLMEHLEVELIRPPVTIGGPFSSFRDMRLTRNRTFTVVTHGFSSPYSIVVRVEKAVWFPSVQRRSARVSELFSG